MIANNNSTASTASASLTDGDKSADMSLIRNLEREIAALNLSAKEKQTEISQLEKECGIKHQSDIVKKLEPVTIAFDNFKQKAKPVLYSAGEKVRTTANNILKRPNSEDGSTNEQSQQSQESPKPDNIDNIDDNEVDIQQKTQRIATLEQSLVDERTLIASKDSEVVWLYKKNNLTRPNAFTKFTDNVRNSQSYQKMGTSLDTAKVKAKENMKVAGEKTKELWASAGIKASRFSASFKESWKKATAKK